MAEVMLSAAARAFILAMADVIMGSILNWHLVTIILVASDNIFTDPVLFPVGSIVMQSSVLDVMLLVGCGECAVKSVPNPSNSITSW